MNQPKVTAVTITYGDRWQFLSKTIEAAMKDPSITTLVIVDNGSRIKEKIEQETKPYGQRVQILRQEKNLGSAGGFGVGLAHARQTDCDFVLLLDDDCVIEDGAIALFMEVYKYFPDKRVVLSGNRLNVPRNEEFFYRPTLSLQQVSPRGTFFEVFSWNKLVDFFRLFKGLYAKRSKAGPFVPVAPTAGFVYGGALIPIEAVRKAPLPDASLFLYGDDIEYSWGIQNLGYTTYACASPKIYDIDLTFGEGSHIFGLFESQTLAFKVYYRIRNMVRISRRNTKQNSVVLFLNIFIWILGLYMLGLFKYGTTPTYWKRIQLIARAVYGGYFPNKKIPDEAMP